MMGEGEVEGVNDDWVGDDRSIDVVGGGVNEVTGREGVGGSHLGTQEDFPDDIKVLEEQGPASLVLRQFARVLYIGEILMVGDDGDRMEGSLDLLLPFLQHKDDSKEFPIIDVVFSLSRNKSFGEVCAGVGVVIEIILKEDGSSREEGSIGHNEKGASDIRDTKDRARGEGIVKGVKGFLLEWSPVPWLVFSCQEVERCDNV